MDPAIRLKLALPLAPFSGAPALPLWLYVVLAVFVVVGTSNAVNLTDGLDGLAIGPVTIAAATFLILAYAAGPRPPRPRRPARPEPPAARAWSPGYEEPRSLCAERGFQ